MEHVTSAREATTEEPIVRINERYSPCLAMLRGLYPRLTSTERRVADYLLGNPGRVLHLPITDLARACEVGVGTISRLCAKLGYSGYPEMKIALAVELLSPDQNIGGSIHEHDDVATVIRKVIEIGIQSLKDTVALLDPAELDRATTAITRARRAEFYATGGISGPIARIAQHRFLILGIPSTAVTEQEQQVASASLLGPEDVALGLSNSGESLPVARALDQARQSGATTICITNAPESPVARAAAIRLLTANRETWIWSDSVASRIPMLGAIDALYANVALRKYRVRADRASSRPTDQP